MKTILILAGALIALNVLRPLIMLVIARVFAGAIGEHALAKQPDTIQLDKAGADRWSQPGRAAANARALETAGFADAGTYTVREMPGLVIQLMANERDNFYAALYEHPKAGSWIDLVTLYGDGKSATFSSNPPTGLNPRPGHLMENVAGAGPAMLLDRAKQKRPRGVYAPHSVQRAVAEFTRAYAESMAWRKSKGVSAGEVAKVLKRAA